VNIVVFMDGVLRGDHGQPLPTGCALYRTFIDTHRLLLVGNDVEADTLWLKAEGMRGHAHLAAIDPLDAEHDVIHRTLTQLRTRGRIDLVIAANPEQATEAFTLGFETMVHFAPKFARPAWRPDKDNAPKAWRSLMEELQAERMAAASVAPLKDE
jgi:hypothetical protein